ncbi:hypothetical protein CHUAL_010485 [Chamberlinius hualienensis]
MEEDICPLLTLPVEIITKIFSYDSYEHIAKLRSVCKTFNEIGSTILNSTFNRLQNLLLGRYHQIKSQMPRRESSRRTHPLAREWDIIETVHMRLTLLEMTFGKHIERKNCCFFAGEILDEVYRIYRYVTSSSNLGRAYRVTDELFELTTMATEYFREYIEPGLPDIIYFSSDLLEYTSAGLGACTWKTPCGTPVTRSTASCSSWGNAGDDKVLETHSPSGALKKRIRRLRQGMKRNTSRLAYLKRELKTRTNQMGDQQRQLIEFSARLEEVEKKYEESTRKFTCVFQELNKCKTELQYWRSKSPANQMCYNCSATVGVLGESSAQGELSVENKTEKPSSDEDLSVYFIAEGNQESPSPKSTIRVNELAQFVPIPVNEASSNVEDGCSTSKQTDKREAEDGTADDDSLQPAAKRQRKALVKCLI